METGDWRHREEIETGGKRQEMAVRRKVTGESSGTREAGDK